MLFHSAANIKINICFRYEISVILTIQLPAADRNVTDSTSFSQLPVNSSSGTCLLQVPSLVRAACLLYCTTELQIYVETVDAV